MIPGDDLKPGVTVLAWPDRKVIWEIVEICYDEVVLCKRMENGVEIRRSFPKEHVQVFRAKEC